MERRTGKNMRINKRTRGEKWMVPFDWVVQLRDTVTHGLLNQADQRPFRNI